MFGSLLKGRWLLRHEMLLRWVIGDVMFDI